MVYGIKRFGVNGCGIFKNESNVAGAVYHVEMLATTPRSEERYIAVFGDWHRDSAWAAKAISSASFAGAKLGIQLGDFGLMGNIEEYLSEVNSALLEADMILFVVPGNHEDHDYLDDDLMFEILESGIRRVKLGHKVDSRIYILPRGFVWKQAGSKMLALGGAASIDWDGRTPGVSWWPQEVITEAEADRIIGENHEDVMAMFSHDAPKDVMALAQVAAQSDHIWGRENIEYAESSRKELDRVFRSVKPKTEFHGHWHTKVDEFGEFLEGDCDSDVFESRIVGLDREDTFENIAIYDVVDDDVYFLTNHNFSLFGRTESEQVQFGE